MNLNKNVAISRLESIVSDIEEKIERTQKSLINISVTNIDKTKIVQFKKAAEKPHNIKICTLYQALSECDRLGVEHNPIIIAVGKKYENDVNDDTYVIFLNFIKNHMFYEIITSYIRCRWNVQPFKTYNIRHKNLLNYKISYPRM